MFLLITFIALTGWAVGAPVIAFQVGRKIGHNDGRDCERARNAQARIRDRQYARQRELSRTDPWVFHAPEMTPPGGRAPQLSPGASPRGVHPFMQQTPFGPIQAGLVHRRNQFDGQYETTSGGQRQPAVTAADLAPVVIPDFSAMSDEEFGKYLGLPEAEK